MQAERLPGLKMSGSPDGIQSQLDFSFLTACYKMPVCLIHHLSAFNGSSFILLLLHALNTDDVMEHVR